MAYDDSLANVTRAELHEELSGMREELRAGFADLRGEMAVMRENMHHLATNDSVERMGRLVLMWTVGTMVAAVAAVVGVMLALPR